MVWIMVQVPHVLLSSFSGESLPCSSVTMTSSSSNSFLISKACNPGSRATLYEKGRAQIHLLWPGLALSTKAVLDGCLEVTVALASWWPLTSPFHPKDTILYPVRFECLRICVQPIFCLLPPGRVNGLEVGAVRWGRQRVTFIVRLETISLRGGGKSFQRFFSALKASCWISGLADPFGC